MSIKCQNWVYEHSESRGNDRLVLLAIADEANDDGTNAHPGIALISRKARLPERTTMRCLERLEEAHRLIVHRPKKRGRGHFNDYVVIMGPPEKDWGSAPSPDLSPDQPPFLGPTKDDTLSGDGPDEKGATLSGDGPDEKGATLSGDLADKTRVYPRNTAQPYLDGCRPIDPLLQTDPPLPPKPAEPLKLVPTPAADAAEGEPLSEPKPTPPTAAHRSAADAIVRTWWDAQDPTPVSSFRGVVTIISRFLAAGEDPDRLAAGLANASCPTTNAIQLAMRRRSHGAEADAQASAALAWFDEEVADGE